jgi:hypothetical protein
MENTRHGLRRVARAEGHVPQDGELAAFLVGKTDLSTFLIAYGKAEGKPPPEDQELVRQFAKG